ncbi:hypothetical protein GLAREA_12016 [Glarea lozoyensis ATCC 20868]|uniref:Protein YAE1 n=1 Tax=Glarea lozoyensis (strain ATCC 20868 / MF5171) TaxID=1116229 RepID=S3D491_GLAL2|nr:uncharacterized protein GLAREA_12016 [Glarea lozoyensis ATCC 20868]EPE31934.1 hypothetical protein GLAREA_12016 [Glarea lozoyensis ATCC 20868]
MFRDDEMYPPPAGSRDDESREVEDDANDILDDVFGSEPGSPAFGGGGANDEYSDIPRLREKHETEGYRDGVTKGKAETVQKGFDEGYSLGAVLGLRIGKVLGLLEGVWGGVRSVKDESEVWDRERARLEVLVKEGREELRTESLFGAEWWGEDGIWKYDVPGEGGEVVWEDVAKAHPLVVKWEGIVDEEVKRWGLDLKIMDNRRGEDEVAERDATDKILDTPAQPTTGVQKKELAW